MKTVYVLLCMSRICGQMFIWSVCECCTGGWGWDLLWVSLTGSSSDILLQYSHVFCSSVYSQTEQWEYLFLRIYLLNCLSNGRHGINFSRMKNYSGTVSVVLVWTWILFHGKRWRNEERKPAWCWTAGQYMQSVHRDLLKLIQSLGKRKDQGNEALVYT